MNWPHMHATGRSTASPQKKKKKKRKKRKKKKKRRSIATQIMMSTHMLIYRFVVLEYVPFILRLVFFFLKE